MSVMVTSFAIFAASQVGTPGPANMALLATGARYGFRRALPFVAGVALGKQLVIWPVGFGLMELAAPLDGHGRGRLTILKCRDRRFEIPWVRHAVRPDWPPARQLKFLAT